MACGGLLSVDAPCQSPGNRMAITAAGICSCGCAVRAPTGVLVIVVVLRSALSGVSAARVRDVEAGDAGVSDAGVCEITPPLMTAATAGRSAAVVS
jgi:hypothetical protein